MSSRKRKALTLEERVKVIERSLKGESAISIAKSLDVGKTQIQNIIIEKDAILQRWESGDNANRKNSRSRLCTYDDINDSVWKWFCDARSRNIPVSGKLMQEKALALSIELGHDNFSASNGWLEKFLKRNNIKSCSLSGERGEVNQDTVDDWKKRLPFVCEGYEPCNIYNADETGLYYRAIPSKSMAVKGSDCGGVKISKDRITVLLAASVTGDKLMPLIIGKSEKPRCFQGCDMKSLGVDYYFNSKAWMTSKIFLQWSNKLNNKMKIQGRSILMFIDNCPAHPPIQLSNVKFVMLPPNTTSRLQPCDAGIIQAFKLHYRKQLLRHILFEMENDSTVTGPLLVKKVTLLDAVFWLKKSWRLVQPTTITKCFVNCGFSTVLQVSEHSIATSEEIDNSSDSLESGFGKLLDGIQMEDFSSFDDNIQTSTESEDCHFEGDVIPDVSDVKDDEDGEEEEPAINFKTAATYARQLVSFAVKNNLPELTDTLSGVAAEIERVYLHKQTNKQQASLFNFFKKL